MKHHLIAVAATALAVTGCAPQAAQQSAATEDFNIGIAKTCTPSPVDLSKTNTATIAMTNDGFCALHLKDKNGQPYKFGLLKVRPQHGFINIHQINGDTRIDYTADARYVGPDRFTVALASAIPNTPDSTVQATVTVSMGEGMAPAPAPAPAPATRTTTPARTRH